MSDLFLILNNVFLIAPPGLTFKPVQLKEMLQKNPPSPYNTFAEDKEKF